MVPFTFIKPFLTEEVHASDSDASIAIAVFGIAATCGRLMMNVLADVFRREHVLQCALCVMAVSVAVWPHVSTVGGTIAAIIVPYGLMSGAYIGIPPAIVGQYFGKSDGQHLALLSGFLWLANGIGMTAGPPLAGALVDATDSYVLSGALSAVFQLVAAAMLCLLPRPEVWAATRATLGASAEHAVGV